LGTAQSIIRRAPTESCYRFQRQQSLLGKEGLERALFESVILRVGGDDFVLPADVYERFPNTQFADFVARSTNDAHICAGLHKKSLACAACNQLHGGPQNISP
jgi:hypothetical protein